MTRTLKTLLLSAAAAVSAAGCATKYNGAEQALSIEEEHPISVDSQTVTMTMAPSASLSSLDRARLRAFADAYMRDGHGALTLTSPGGADAGQGSDVRAALSEFGVPADSVAAASYRTGEGSSADLILSYTHYVATASACGVWEGQKDRDFRNMRSPNFGCSMRNNLAAMVGDPRDLVEPAAMTDPDSAIRIRGVRLFREGNVTSSETDGELDQAVSN
jgi:pilus assembly protein CpaD